jgi:hypothetical protein
MSRRTLLDISLHEIINQRSERAVWETIIVSKYHKFLNQSTMDATHDLEVILQSITPEDDSAFMKHNKSFRTSR